MKHALLFSLICICSQGAIASPIHSHTLTTGHPVLQLGAYENTQGKSQHINIDSLIGNYFTVSKHHSSNGLVGVGYYLNGPQKQNINLNLGINFFYLPKTAVTGTIIQEGLFENLSYIYNVTHYPVYAIAKAQLTQYAHPITLNLGVGPNFMKTSHVLEHSLDGGLTIPERMFSGKSTITASATAGAGIQFNHVLGKTPMECGYQFFYLGQSNFNPRSNQILNTLSTGHTYANALMCAIKI